MVARNPLTDVIPASARRYVYAILWLAALAMTAYRASQGDWFEAVAYVLGALGFGTAQANINSTDQE